MVCVCKEYGMEVNVKKTNQAKYSVQSQLMAHILEHVLQYKYLGSWITEDWRCKLDIKTRVAMTKDAFWKHKELLQGNIGLQVKKKM